MPSNRPKFNQQELLTLLVVMRREMSLVEQDVEKARSSEGFAGVMECFLDELNRQRTIVTKLEQLTAPKVSK